MSGYTVSMLYKALAFILAIIIPGGVVLFAISMVMEMFQAMLPWETGPRKIRKTKKEDHSA